MRKILTFLFSKQNLKDPTTKVAFLLFILFNFVFWGIFLDHELRKIFYLFLRNLAGDTSFVGAVGALITGGISGVVGILWAYKNNKGDKKC